MASKRSLEERIREKDERMQKALEKAKQYEAQKKQLEQRQKEVDRKARAHRLIEIGAAAESVLGREFVTGDIERFLNFLKTQERNIVKLNSADMILKENERLKAEAYAAKTEAWNVKNTYAGKMEELEASIKAADEQKKQAESALKNEARLILANANKIAKEKITRLNQSHRSHIHLRKG